MGVETSIAAMPPARAKSRLVKGWFRLLTWLGPDYTLYGLPVWAPLSKATERSQAYERLADALYMLRRHAPVRYDRVLRLLNGFLIFGTDPDANASYDPINGVCRLGASFMVAPTTTSVEIACAVVHEATHAWLFKLGIGYDEPIRHRVELVCIRAALLAARKLPGGEAEVERCRAQMSIDPEYFSNRSFVDRKTHHLRELGCPEWIIQAALWMRRKRAT